jgi:hypothetical protein
VAAAHRLGFPRARVVEGWHLLDLRDAAASGNYPVVGLDQHLYRGRRGFHAVVVAAVTSRFVIVHDLVGYTVGLLPTAVGRFTARL